MIKLTMFKGGNIINSGDHFRDAGILYRKLYVKQYETQISTNDEFIITLSETKKGVHVIDCQKYKMTGRQIHLVLPGQSSHFNFLEYTTAFQIKMTQKNFEKLRLSLPFDSRLYKDYPVFGLSEKEFQKLNHEVEKIGSELSRYQPFLPIIDSRTGTTFHEVIRLLTNRISNLEDYTLPVVLNRFLNLIEMYYKQEHAVGFYSSALNVTKNYLAGLSQQYLQTTSRDLINNRILKEAQHLLSLKSSSIKATMLELGFEDKSTFSHFFKRHLKMSPTAYRNIKIER